MYRMSFLQAVAIDGEIFDEDFFAFREDADLAWRGRVMGFRALYSPPAIGHHVRRVTPERRAQLPADINMHSVKNRFLLLAKNETWEGLRPDLGPFLAREAVIVGGVLLRERSSLRAYPLLVRALGQALRDRKWIQARRRVSGAEMRPRFLA